LFSTRFPDLNESLDPIARSNRRTLLPAVGDQGRTPALSGSKLRAAPTAMPGTPMFVPVPRGKFEVTKLRTLDDFALASAKRSAAVTMPAKRLAV
jgi:hypothetical protein